MKRIPSILAIIVTTLVLMPCAALEAGDENALTLGTSFTYQGVLKQQGADAEGVFDFEFELYDRAEGGQFFGNITHFDQPVSAGTFSADLDFGKSITGATMWLEIHVREAGGGTFSVLAPRQKLEGSKTSACTVDSDLVVNGAIGAKGDRLGFLDPSGSETMGFGIYEFYNLEYLTLRTANADQVFLSGGGNLGIGIIPSVPLDVVGGTDASPGGGGFVVIGPQDGKNIVMDNNEIIARDSGQTSTLHLNHDGGDVSTGGDLVVGGSLDIGYQIVEAQCPGGVQNWCTVACPAGKKVISGGCRTSGGAYYPVILSYAPSETEWHCATNATVPNASLFHAQAVCARID